MMQPRMALLAAALLLVGCAQNTEPVQTSTQETDTATITPTTAEQSAAAGGQHTFNVYVQAGCGETPPIGHQGLDMVKATSTGTTGQHSADNLLAGVTVNIDVGSTSTGQEASAAGTTTASAAATFSAAQETTATQDIRTRVAAEFLVQLAALADALQGATAGEGSIKADKRTEADLDIKVPVGDVGSNGP